MGLETMLAPVKFILSGCVSKESLRSKSSRHSPVGSSGSRSRYVVVLNRPICVHLNILHVKEVRFKDVCKDVVVGSSAGSDCRDVATLTESPDGHGRENDHTRDNAEYRHVRGQDRKNSDKESHERCRESHLRGRSQTNDQSRG
jgi:hypothetical protein